MQTNTAETRTDPKRDSTRLHDKPSSAVRMLLIVSVASLCLLKVDSTCAQEQTRLVNREYKIKAAFMMHFASLVKWPENAMPAENATITIGLLGTDPFDGALDKIDGKVVSGRRIVVQRYATLDDLQDCHILFISQSEQSRLSAVLQRIKGMHLLTVSDIPGFARQWGIVGFKMAGNKVRFEINRDAARKNGLKISSRLLRVADGVDGRDESSHPSRDSILR